MRPPEFWRHDSGSLLPALLSPLSAIVSRVTARRVARPGWLAPVPVICCGNATVGGAGKTTLALDLCTRLAGSGLRVHCLTRGYGGSARGPLRVDPDRHDARLAGDEALLLAAVAPCWVGGDRAASARAAVEDGAQVIVMDDGLQNPGLVQTCALLVIDGAAGFGNGRVLPAGPLREPVACAARRVRAAVLIGGDAAGSLADLPPTMPVLRARLAAGPELAALRGRRVLAFAGIGRPDKFFAMLEEGGLDVAGRMPFADHHEFTGAEIAGLEAKARRLDATLVTTPKDHVRLSPKQRMDVHAIGVSLAWEDAAAVEALLDQAMR